MTGEDRPVGLTKDVGYQIGVRRTVSIPLEEAWDLLISRAGLTIWLGGGNPGVRLGKGCLLPAGRRIGWGGPGF